MAVSARRAHNPPVGWVGGVGWGGCWRAPGQRREERQGERTKRRDLAYDSRSAAAPAAAAAAFTAVAVRVGACRIQATQQRVRAGRGGVHPSAKNPRRTGQQSKAMEKSTGAGGPGVLWHTRVPSAEAAGRRRRCGRGAGRRRLPGPRRRRRSRFSRRARARCVAAAGSSLRARDAARRPGRPPLP